MNFYFETKTLLEINEGSFISLCTDKVENSSPKEYFSMFATYFSKDTKEVVTQLLDILKEKSLLK